MNKAAIPLEVRRHKLVASVRNRLHDNVLVGISGGADSTALLLLCCAVSLQQSSNLKVVAGHINHGIRSESDEEQKMVEALCEKLGVVCISKKITVTPIDGSLAAGARKGRYDALASIATEHDLTQIAVAHHATDQIETMLMALCRGGGPRKLAGMAAERTLADGISLVRPLLHADQHDLRSICTLCGVSWCDDPTNSDPTTPRGKLRLEVLPKLRDLWPAADRHAANASVMLQAAADALDSKAMLYEKDHSWNRKTLAVVSQEIVATLMHKAVGSNTSFETVQSIAAAITDTSTEPRVFDCGAGCIVRVTANEVCVVQP